MRLRNLFFNIVIIYFEGEKWSRGGTERGRERERERIPSRPPAVSAEPNTGLEPTNHAIMT